MGQSPPACHSTLPSASRARLNQTCLSLSFADGSQCGDHFELFGAWTRIALLPVVHGLGTHAHQLAVIRSGQTEATPLRLEALGDEAERLETGCGRWWPIKCGAPKERHLTFKSGHLTPQCCDMPAMLCGGFLDRLNF